MAVSPVPALSDKSVLDELILVGSRVSLTGSSIETS